MSLPSIPSIDLHIYRYDEIDESHLPEFQGSMSKEELERFNLLASKNLDRGNRYIAERGLLRELLGKTTGEAPESLQFTRGQHGKPMLTYPKPIFFNLSHCDDLFALALSPDVEVGVDIENAKRSSDFEKIAERYFSRAEFDFLKKNSAQLPANFTLLWTMKESIGKMLGSGISDELLENATTIQQNQAVPNLGWLTKPARLNSFRRENHIVSVAAQTELKATVNLRAASSNKTPWQLI